MAVYDMIIEAKSATQEVPNRVWIVLDNPWEPWISNTWRINTPNTWIGIGSGEFKYISGSLYFTDGKFSAGKNRFSFNNIRFPDDCTPYVDPSGVYVRRGECYYVVPNRPQLLGAAKWHGTNIWKDEPA
jgi:hypothetical protein